MSFTIGNKTAQSLKIRMLEDSQIPILPETIDRTVVIPGRAGAYYFGAEHGPRHFGLECAFHDSSLTSDTALQSAIRDLAEHLVDGRGRPRELTLTFDRETSRHYTVRYSGALPIERMLYHSTGIFVLPLIAYDPYAYTDEIEFDRQLTTSPQNETFEVVSGLNVPLTMILDNEGVNTLDGFSFKTYELIEDWSVHS